MESETTAIASVERPTLATVIRMAMSEIADRLTHDITPPQITQLYGSLKSLEDNIVNMADLAKARLLEHIKNEGVKTTEAGSLKAQFGEYEIEATVRNSGYDPKKVQVLLRSLGMQPEAGMDATITYKCNGDKLGGLVSVGKLSAEALEECRYEIQYNVKRPKRVYLETDTDE